MSDAKCRSLVWGTGLMEEVGLQFGIPVEWNSEFSSLGNRTNETGRFTLCVTGRKEQNGL